jgi:hypothetical protein
MAKGSIQWESKPSKLVVTLKPSPEDFLSKEAVEHFKTAEREIVMALNSLKSPKKDKAKKAKSSKRMKVVEIE